MAPALLLLGLILLNGLLSMSEMAIASARRARLQAQARAGSGGAQAALDLAASPNRFLSTVQIGITLTGILAGALGEVALVGAVSRALGQLPIPPERRDVVAFAVVIALVTYLSLVLGELVPKRLALADPERIAAAVARPMRTLSTVAAPVVGLLGASTDLILRLLRVRPGAGPSVTQEEIDLLLEEGASAGVLDAAESEMIGAVFDLGERRAADLMTPRHRMVALDLQDPPEANRRRMAESPHRAFPVTDGGGDNLVGMVATKDLWARNLEGASTDLRQVMTPPLVVPETLLAPALLERFREAGQEVAVVIDEYGGVQGIVTLHDLFEAIVGTLQPPAPDRREEAVARADGSWLLDGMLPAHEVCGHLGLDALPGEESGDFDTLGGYVMTVLGRIPRTGDVVEGAGWRFEVVDMDGRRVDRVLASREVG